MLVSAYPNGSTAGSPPPPRDHSMDAKRKAITGWTRDAVRRHTKWLYSVESDRLTGVGIALTLSLRDIPETGADWTRTLEAWRDRMRKDSRWSLIRLHWVVEWQRRGAPHAHVALYVDDVTGAAFPAEWVMQNALLHWLQVAKPYGASWKAQHGDSIDGALGWLQYLSKHAARGVAHYQRMGHPEGWESTGRLWGKSGDWPSAPPMRFDMSARTYHRYRRLIRSWRIAQARTAGNARRISSARRMLSCSDPRLSPVRGVSEWASEPVVLTLIGMLHDEGHLILQREDAE